MNNPELIKVKVTTPTKEVELLLPNHSIAAIQKKGSNYEVYLTQECVTSLGLPPHKLETIKSVIAANLNYTTS